MDIEEIEEIIIVEESSEKFEQSPKQEGNVIAQETELKGLGGWLILVGFGRVVSVLQSFFIMFTMFIPLLTNGTLKELSSPVSEAYSPLWIPTIYFEFGGNLIILGLHIALCVLFFMKKRLFPKLFIRTYIFMLAFAIIDAMILRYLQSTITFDINANSFVEIFQIFGVAVIWIPYMLKSVRVRNTFVQ